MMIITKEVAALVVASVVAAFSAVAWLEAEDAKQDAVVAQQTTIEVLSAIDAKVTAAEARLNTRVSMSDRARYGELYWHYQNKLDSGATLDAAEQESLELAERQIHRIHGQLVE